MNFLTRLNTLKVLESQYSKCRHYTRWSHRRPKRVLTPEEYAKIESQYQEDNITSVSNRSTVKNRTNLNLIQAEEKEQLHQKLSKLQWAPKDVKAERLEKDKLSTSEFDEASLGPPSKSYTTNKRTRKKKLVYKTMNDAKLESTDMLETIIDSDGNFVYTKLRDKDPAFSQVLVTAKSPNNPEKKNVALLEGKRLIKEALEADCKLESIVFSRKSDLEYIKPFLPKTGAKLYKIPYKEIQMWSDLSTSPGIMGIFKIPKVEKFIPSKDCLEVIVVCDNIREPGNLGAVLRVAVGVGAQSVLLTKGCVDLWDSKVLRSACGAHFQLQIHRKMDWSDVESHLQTLKGSVLIADNKIITDVPHSESSSNLEDIIFKLPLLPYYSVKFTNLGTIIVIVGGETEGISGDAYRFAAEHSGLRLNIPMSNNVDSLNTGTALGIILFEIKRQLACLKYNNTDIIQNC